MRWPLHRTAVDRPRIRRSLSPPVGLVARQTTTTSRGEDDNFVGLGGGADKPGADGTPSNRMVDKADEGAKEKTEERRSGVVREDEERRLAAARAGSVRHDERRAMRERGGRRRTQ